MVSKKGVTSKVSIGLLFCLILTLLSGKAQVTAAPVPVVQNPGFELPGAGLPTLPNNWAFFTTTDPPEDFSWFYPTGWPHNGAESAGILVNASGAEAGDYAEYTQSGVSPIVGGASYNLSVWVFITAPPNLFVEVGVYWQDSVGTQLGADWTAPFNIPQGIWFEKYLIANSAPGSTQCTIILRVSVQFGDPITAGDVFFDDVMLYPLGDSELGGNTPGDHGSHFDPDADPYNEMLQINVSATNEGLVNLNFTLVAFGTADDSTDIAQVDLIYDRNADGVFDTGDSILVSGSYGSDDGTLQLNSGFSIAQGYTDTFLIAYQLTFTATAGETFRFNVTQILAIGFSSGLTIQVAGPPYMSAIKTMVGSVVASFGDNSPSSHDWAPNGITPNVLLQLDLFAIGEAFTVESITLTIGGTGDTVHVINVLVILDVDGNGVYDATDELVGTGLGQTTTTVSLDPTVVVSQGETEHFLIALTIATTAVEGTTYSVEVTDVDVTGAIDSSNYAYGFPISSTTKTIIVPPPLPFDPLLIILAIVILILVILVIVLFMRRRRSS
jgi:hypothetical protein